jgi:hypothetical protein
MAHLNLTDKKYHTLTLRDKNGIEKEYKIPVELTVAETEAVLALYEEVDELMTAVVSDETSQFRFFWDKMFGMCTILFQHYQPEITETDLRNLLSTNDVLTLTNFFNSNRYLKVKEENEKKALAD